MKSIVELEKKITEQLKAKKDQVAEKTPEELKHEKLEKELIENNEALEAIKPTLDKEPAKKQEEEDKIHTTKPMEEHYVEPVKNPNEICPFCEKEKSAQGMSRHIIAKHGIRGITIEDLNRIEQGEITPDALADEKEVTEIFGLSPEVDEKYFSNWKDTEENPKDTEKEKPKPESVEEAKKDPEKEAKEKKGNGRGEIVGLIIALGTVFGGALAIEKIPSLKKLVSGEGSNPAPQSSSKKSYAQHAIDVNKARNNK